MATESATRENCPECAIVVAPLIRMLMTFLDKLAKGVAWRFTALQQTVWDIAVRFEMMRETDADIDTYTRRVNALHRKLRVPRDYGQRGLLFYREASDLAAVPGGVAGRECLMTHVTRSQWLAMQAAASTAGITLLVRVGFRTIDEQANLIRDQLRRGLGINQILTGIAAPGYSEHHTGRALDIDCVPTQEEFENTPAFEWLCRNAAGFGFQLSYPRDNAYGIIFEPWHWCCHTGEASHFASTDPTRGGR